MVRSRIVAVDLHDPSTGVIEVAAAALERGEIVIAPTETRYGMLVRADSMTGLERLYRIKDRSLSLPTAIFLADPADVGPWAKLNPVAEALAKAFLPGPLTLVLDAVGAAGPPLVVDGKIGIRVSSAPVMQRLMDRAPAPLTAPG